MSNDPPRQIRLVNRFLISIIYNLIKDGFPDLNNLKDSENEWEFNKTTLPAGSKGTVEYGYQAVNVISPHGAFFCGLKVTIDLTSSREAASCKRKQRKIAPELRKIFHCEVVIPKEENEVINPNNITITLIMETIALKMPPSSSLPLNANKEPSVKPLRFHWNDRNSAKDAFLDWFTERGLIPPPAPISPSKKRRAPKAP